METEVKRLHDEVATLTAAIEAAIEEAIKNGQKSVDGCNDTPGSHQVSNKGLCPHSNECKPKAYRLGR